MDLNMKHWLWNMQQHSQNGMKMSLPFDYYEVMNVHCYICRLISSETKE